MISINWKGRENTVIAYDMVRAFYPECEKNNNLEIRIREERSFLEIEFTSDLDKWTERVKRENIKELSEDNNRKRDIYRILSQRTGKTLPWGILTGIRPVKLASALFENLPYYIAGEVLHRGYMICEEKIKLCREIYLHQKPWHENKEAYNLYIHIPFCPQRCSYCSFATFLANKEDIDLYMEKLVEEIRFERERRESNPLTIYIGGGTPTVLPESHLETLMNLLKDMGSPIEYTVEAGRPDTITKAKLDILKRGGVDRISINPQSAMESTLKKLGRLHNTEEVYKAYTLAREVGIPVLNMDLIIGLPGEGIEELEGTLSMVLDLLPEHVTLHSLSLKNGSELFAFQSQPKEYDKLLRLAQKTVHHMGYRPYYLYRQKRMDDFGENVGYSRIEKPGLYNIFMMEDTQEIVSCGVGGVNKRVWKETGRIERLVNYRGLKEYLERFDILLEKKKKFSAL